ncbi:MAG: AbrB family transcriptional regulator [Thermoprotei archaeon]|nr:MAG: AbrB family transcriptional regulator [Thermoprotei archaeon]
MVELDSHGRIYIPASIRRRLKYRKYRIITDGDTLILEPIKPAIEKYYGIAGKPKYTSPEKIDEAVKNETEKILRKDIH